MDGPWQAAGGAVLVKGEAQLHISPPQTHVDSVSLALPTLVKVRQHDTRGEGGSERGSASAPL